MTKSHYFYALSLSNEVKKSLLMFSNEMKERFPFKKWVHHEDYHITLAFLGHINSEQLTSLNQDLEWKLKNTSEINLTIEHTGVFGKSDAPRILWAGMEQSEPLIQLQKIIYEHCVENGLKLDKRPYNPHITLARKWDSDDPFNLQEFRSYSEQKFPVLSDTIQAVTLFQTHLDRSPKYEIRKRFKLQI